MTDLVRFVGLVMVAGVVLYPLLMSTLYAVLVPAVLGRTVPFGDAVRTGLRRTPAMLGYYVLVTLVGILLLAAVAAVVVSSLISIPTSIVGSGTLMGGIASVPSTSTFGTYFVINGVGTRIAGTVLTPFVAGVLGLIYVDRRIRTENHAWDLAAQAGAPGA